MSKLVDKLNERQLKAVVTTEGPVMVMAGAGSGKTRVLTHRIAYIIEELGISPKNILAVTFTNKAAREMKERIASLIEAPVDRMWVSTFHSICARLLRIEISKIERYRPNFTIIDEEDSVKIIRDVIKSMEYDIKEVKPKVIKGVISDYKNGIYDSFKDTLTLNIYEEYQKILVRENLLDFDDLILVSIELFKTSPQTLAKYQDIFKYILVDEFQDTNTPQYKLIYMLAIKHHNIFVVGDQDQSIYSFRGAKIENIDAFIKDFVQTEVILLEENYRSTSSILNLANNVISNNQNRFKKNLFTSNNEGNMPTYYNADSSYDEVMYVIEKIRELKYASYNYSDFAVIYRANALSRNFEDSFIKYQIPYTIYGGVSFFSRREIKDIIAYLRIMINQEDDFAFKRIVNEPKRKVGPAVLTRLQSAALSNNCSLFNAIDIIYDAKASTISLIDFKDIIIYLYDQIENIDRLSKIVDLIIDKTGYYDMLKKEGEDGLDRLDNIKEFKSVLQEAEEFYEGSRIEKLQQLLSDLALRTQTDKKDESEDCVKLMTYHQAKGLEYNVVFLPAFEQGIFPSANCFSRSELEEERRVCYVGITRAKERLYITSAEQRFMYGSTSTQMPSIYLHEMGLDNLNVLGMIKKKEFISQVKTFKPVEVQVKEKTMYKIGDKISHKLFGDGLIVNLGEDDLITVAFSIPYGIKKLNSTHPSIRKIK